MSILKHKEKLILATKIHDKLIGSSVLLGEKEKQHFKHVSSYIRNILKTNPKANIYSLKTLTNELLSYWNESISSETEKFWEELRANNIDLKRKEPLRFALNKKRFRTVENGIDARKNWSELIKYPSIIKKFSKNELGKITEIIVIDEEKRLTILKKYLAKKAIPQTQYLKFGECMAYFSNCRLFEKYFTIEEAEALYNIWKKFKAN
ncbi:MAG TPA: hypothetical protein VKT28_21095 [Puia sp.]|nr:hypothetical protein [Puia sp.]